MKARWWLPLLAGLLHLFVATSATPAFLERLETRVTATPKAAAILENGDLTVLVDGSGAELVRLGADGAVKWAVGLDSQVAFGKMAAVSDGNDGVFVVLESNDSGWRPSPQPGLRRGTAISRFGSDGEVVWQRRFTSGDGGDLTGGFAARTADGGVVVAGEAGPNDVSAVPALWKVSAAGTPLWGRSFSVRGRARFEAVAARAAGGMLVAGSADGSPWLLVLSAEGDVEKSLRFPADCGGFDSVTETTDGAIWVAGHSDCSSRDDVVVLRLGLEAGRESAWAIGGPGSESTAKLAALGTGVVIGVATTSAGAGSTDLWLGALDATGAVLWNGLLPGGKTPGAGYRPPFALAVDDRVVLAAAPSTPTKSGRGSSPSIVVSFSGAPPTSLFCASGEGVLRTKPLDLPPDRLDFGIRPLAVTRSESEVRLKRSAYSAIPGCRDGGTAQGKATPPSSSAPNGGSAPIDEMDLRDELRNAAADLLLVRRFEALDAAGSSLLASRETFPSGYWKLAFHYEGLRRSTSPRLGRMSPPEHRALLEDWARERPDSGAARIALAESLLDELEPAEEAIEAAERLSPNDPELAVVRMRINRSIGLMPPELLSRLDRALEIRPPYRTAISEATTTLRKAIGPNAAPLANFADEITRRTRDQLGEGAYAWVAINVAPENAWVYYRSAFSWPRLRQAFADLSTRFPPSPRTLAWEVSFARRMNDRSTARRAAGSKAFVWNRESAQVFRNEQTFRAVRAWAEAEPAPWVTAATERWIGAGQRISGSQPDAEAFAQQMAMAGPPALLRGRVKAENGERSALGVLAKARGASFAVFPRSFAEGAASIDVEPAGGSGKRLTGSPILPGEFSSPAFVKIEDAEAWGFVRVEIAASPPEVGDLLWLVGCGVESATTHRCETRLYPRIAGFAGPPGTLRFEAPPGADERFWLGAAVFDSLGQLLGVAETASQVEVRKGPDGVEKRSFWVVPPVVLP